MSRLNFPLYNGTDLNIFNLSKDIRDKYKTAAMHLIPFFIELYNKNEFQFKNSTPWNIQEENQHRENLRNQLGQEMYQKVHTYFGKACSIGSPLYEYEDFYVTSYKDFAINYAQNACYYGELGSIVYYLIKGAEILKYEYKLTEVQMLSYKLLSELWRKPACPALIIFNEVEIENLMNHNGTQIVNNIHKNGSYRFKIIPKISEEMIYKL